MTGLPVTPSNCDSVTTTVVVSNLIDAIADVFPTQTSSTTVQTTVGDVTANDTLNGVLVTAANTDVTPVIAGPISIDAAGILTLAPNTPSGSYPITYTICEVDPVTGFPVTPSNCDSVTTTIVVSNPIDAIADVFPTQTPGTTVPTTVGDVTANDTLNGVAVTVANTDVTPITTGPLSIDAAGSLTLAPNTPSGSYPITYTICEVDPVTGVPVTPSNCDSITDTIVVSGSIDAVTDNYTATPISGTNGGSTPSVLANDTLNGVILDPATVTLSPVGTVPAGLTLNADGTISVAPNTPAGSYTVTYSICEIANPTNCNTDTATVAVTAPIDAIVDNYTATPISGTNGDSTPSVLANDTLNGVILDPATVTLSPVGTVPTGLTLNADGTISVAPNTPAGSYTLTYSICEIANPSNCNTDTATVAVTAPIDAIVDNYTATPINGTNGGSTPSVLANDTLNGVILDPATVTLSPVGTVPAGLTLNADGTISVAPNTPAGSYTLTYSICEIANPTNCNTDTATVAVTAPIDAIVDNYTATPINGTNGGSTPSVLANDTLNGVILDPATVTLSPVGTVPAELILNADGTISVAPNTPAGSYTLTYSICEIANPTNCNTDTATVAVTAPIDAIVDNYTATPINGTNGDSTPSVLANDTLNGVILDPATVTLSPVGTVPAGLILNADGTISVAPNTPAGVYVISYSICEKANLSNCNTDKATIAVTAPIDAINDVIPTTNGGLGNPTAGNILTNDLLNGIPVKVSDVNLTVSTQATPVIPGAPVPVIDPATGIVRVPAGTPAGTYTITYQICEKLNAVNCDTAVITVPVSASVIKAVDDDYTGTLIQSSAGGKTAAVLGNDTINGNPIVLGGGQIKLTGITVPSGLTLNADGTVSVAPNSASGTYILNYTICDVINPTNCASATATIKILAQNPSIALIKTAELLDENGDGLTQVGEKIRYDFTVTNTGDVPLTNITISDLLPGLVLSGGPISLLAGQSDSTTFTAAYTITAQDLRLGTISNQATVSGTSPTGIIVKDLSDGDSITKDGPTVLAIEGCKIEVFNSVSPNGDGYNDFLYIEGLDCYAKNTVEIYNRWGVLVYSKDGYDNKENAFKGFSDGRVTIKQSEGLPDGTYYYILNFTDFEGRQLSKSGYLYLAK